MELSKSHQMTETIKVKVPTILKNLIPNYIQNRHEDIITLREALDQRDYERIKILGHQIKGSGAGYGFQALTDFGTELEQYACDENNEAILTCINQIAEYMNCVDITFT